MTGARPSPPQGSPPSTGDVGRALLLDLCAWLGAWPGPVPAEVPYALEGIRAVEGGRARLAIYLPAELLQRWDAALSPLLAGGRTVDVRLDALSFEATAPDSGRIEFIDITGGADRRWRLDLRVDGAAGRVLDAWFTRLAS